MSDSKLATFRIDAAQWQEFQARAKAGGTNASALLLGFIQNYLDGNIDSGIDTTKNRIDVDIDRNLDNRIQAAIAPIQQEVAELRNSLGELRSLIQQGQATPQPRFQTGTEPPTYNIVIDTPPALVEEIPTTGEKSDRPMPPDSRDEPESALTLQEICDQYSHLSYKNLTRNARNAGQTTLEYLKSQTGQTWVQEGKRYRILRA